MEKTNYQKLIPLKKTSVGDYIRADSKKKINPTFLGIGDLEITISKENIINESKLIFLGIQYKKPPHPNANAFCEINTLRSKAYPDKTIKYFEVKYYKI